MNKVEAIIRPEKLATVKKALTDAGFGGMNVISGSGQGVHEGVSRHGGRGTSKYVDYTLPNVKPESTEGGRRVSVLKRQEGAPVLLG